jgi:3-hydroxyisobutyrate dehydrogenase-like beta-hydroxyacid dehydrogenase
MPLHQIGLAGCGRMGEPMLAALIAAGFAAKGFDIRPSASYGSFAGHVLNDPEGFAAPLDTLFSVVRDIPQTEAVLFSDQGLVHRAPALRHLVICSTVAPSYIADLRARLPDHIALIDAPMSGASVAAREKRLSFMLGGSLSEIAQVQPCLDAMGQSFHHMGALGAGMSAKVLNNILAAANTVTTRLVLDWADDAGLERTALLDLIAASSGQNWFASGFERIEFARDGYGEDNSIGILKKDVQSALTAAPVDADTRLPELLCEMLAGLRPDQDT